MSTKTQKNASETQKNASETQKKSMFLGAWLTSKLDSKKKWASVNEVRDSLLHEILKKGYPRILRISVDSICDMLIIDVHNYWLEQVGIIVKKYDFAEKIIIFDTEQVETMITAGRVRSLGYEPTSEQVEREKKEQAEEKQARYGQCSQMLSELGIQVDL